MYFTEATIMTDKNPGIWNYNLKIKNYKETSHITTVKECKYLLHTDCKNLPSKSQI